MSACFHCGLPAQEQFSATVAGEEQLFCCVGCQAVAQAIESGGLADFYRFRDSTNEKPNDLSHAYSEYDLDDIQADIITPKSETEFRVQFFLAGISCAACAWLIENHLSKHAAIRHVAVNATTQICSVEWDKNSLPLSGLMRELELIGYSPKPATSQAYLQSAQAKQRSTLLRLGVAGIGMMQVGMVAVALYAGGIQGIDAGWQGFLRWVSLVFATPVVLYSAQPFFSSAWRALKMKALNMDAPVCIALVLAYGASVYATLTHSGEVYFDSVSMFTFFLLLGRYLEMRARNSNQSRNQHLLSMLPLTANKILSNDESSGSSPRAVPLKSVVVGDVLQVESGSVFPVDGKVLSGTTFADESLLTGESTPIAKSTGDSVIAGSLNGDTAVAIQVTAVGTDTALAAIEAMVEDAQQQKPAQVALADRIAGRFVTVVLILAVVIGGVWCWYDVSRALWVVLSVLVITCPCALSLATPAALTAGTSRLRRLGFLVRSKHVIESLANISHVVFDKTGTLTQGHFRIERVELAGTATPMNVQQVQSIIASLEQHSKHPIAKAFREIPIQCVASQVTVKAGEGIEGIVDGQLYKFGKPSYALAGKSLPGPHLSESNPNHVWQCLSCPSGLVAWVCLSDSMREESPSVIEYLRTKQYSVALLSGDRQANVDTFCSVLKKHSLGSSIDVALGDVSPTGKLAYVHERQAEGGRVLMVGDGINDAPVLSGADVSVAMPQATQLAQMKSDAMLLNDNLQTLQQAFEVSGSVQRTIRQNLMWALGYNLLALPAAAMGLIPPYLAAAGMSLSSLVVVLNSLRINR